MLGDPGPDRPDPTPPTLLDRLQNPNINRPSFMLPIQSKVNKAKKRTAQRSNAAPDDILMLQNMLGSFGGASAVDMSSLQAELQKAIAGQYDPQISNIKGGMASAKKRTAKAQTDIGSLYNDLASYYTGQVGPAKQQEANYKAQAKQSGDAAKQSITQDYANRMQDQLDQYKSLGIDAAASSATQGQSEEQANALAVAQQTSQAEQSALNVSGNADVNYWQEGSGIAKGEGADQQAALTQQLTDYLNQQGGQLAVLKGQKSSAYNQGLIQLQQQQAADASKQQNDMWTRLLELAKLKNSMASSGSSGTSKGLTGALSYLGDSNQGGLGNTFQQYLSEAQAWGNSAQGKQYYGGTGPQTPEQWAQVIKDDAANHHLSSQQQTALWQAALRYYGRG